MRERAIKFLSTKFMTFSAELITKEVEELLVEKSKEVSLVLHPLKMVPFAGSFTYLKITSIPRIDWQV